MPNDSNRITDTQRLAIEALAGIVREADEADEADTDEAFAFADERHEIVEALAVPEGTLPSDFADYCRDVLDAALEAAGFVAAEGEVDPAEIRVVLAHLPATDLVLLARGGDLPAGHPFLRALRGEAA